MSELSNQNVAVMQEEVEGQMKDFLNPAEIFEQEERIDLLRIVRLLKEIVKQNHYIRMGLASPDGQAAMTDDVVLDLPDQNYFKRSCRGEIHWKIMRTAKRLYSVYQSRAKTPFAKNL